MRALLISFLIIFSASAIECERDSGTDCENAICTMEFRYLTIQIKHDSDKSGVLLSSYKVIRVSDNKDLTIIDNVLDNKMGYYPLVNDSQRAILSNTNVEIEFQGFIQNSLVVTKRFVVTADCCHVSLVSGETLVYI